MELELSEAQRLLKDMVDRLVAEHYGFDQRSRIVASPAGWSREAWDRFAELGLLTCPFAEADGGLGGGGVEAMIVAQAFGRGLVPEPYMATAVLAGTALSHAPPSDARTELIAALMAGKRLAAFGEGRDLRLTQARVFGRAPMVLGGEAADWLMLAAPDAAGAVSLALLAGDGEGVAREPYRLHGGGMAADVRFHGAPVVAVLAGPKATPAIQVRVAEAAIAFLVAEALGAAEAVFHLTVDYLQSRVQFDKPLGANQVIQHRAAEMFVELEQLRSAALYAAMMRDAEDADERARAMSAAKIVANRTARFLGQQAIQLHGGMGVAEEYAAGHYFKRLTAISLLFGDTDAHVDALAARGGFVRAEPHWARGC